MFTFPSSMFHNSILINTQYSGDLGFILVLRDDTTNIAGFLINIHEDAVWENRVYQPPESPTTSSYSNTVEFSVTPDLADVDIDGDLYVDTGDRYFDHTVTSYLDIAEPYWSMQVQFSIRARWSFGTSDYYGYDVSRCSTAGIRVIPSFGTTAAQRANLDSLPSTFYSTFILSGTYPIASTSVTVDYPNITTESVDFGSGYRVLYIIEESGLGFNVDDTTSSPEKITSPLYWYWTSPSTSNNYDL